MSFLYKKVECDFVKHIQDEIFYILSEENKSDNFFKSYEKNLFLGCFGLLELIDKVNVKNWEEIDSVCIVTTKPKDKLPIHKDTGGAKKSIYSLNVPIKNCHETYNLFFEDTQDDSGLIKSQKHGDDYLYYDDNLKVVDKLYMKDDIYWFNTQVPHNAVNPTNSHRIILSVRFVSDLPLNI